MNTSLEGIGRSEANIVRKNLIYVGVSLTKRDLSNPHNETRYKISGISLFDVSPQQSLAQGIMDERRPVAQVELFHQARTVGFHGLGT